MERNSMRYIYAERPGGPEVLVVKEGPPPVPGSGEVLIRVYAAGINRPDIMQREGKYPPPAGASPLLGLEVAGEVSAVGGGVSRWSEGDQVCALTNGGGYAEFVTAPAGQCLPVPAGLRMEEAAALPETFFTVWTNVFDRASLKEGESFLVHGGSGGIGTTAIQMAKQRGARVFTTAGTGEKCTACRRLGAEIAVNYREDDFVQVLKEATDGRGVDVILDMIGGEYVSRNLNLAATDGRVVNIAFQKGSRVEIDLMKVLIKRLTLTGSALRPRTPEAKAEIAAKLEAEIWPLIESDRIRPVMAATFLLEKAADAHRLMEQGSHIGKIVLISS
jgi:NADPH2:quinone reductase